MQLRHLQSITQPSEGIQKVTSLCWAPNGKKLAVVTTDRVVVLFDETGARKDKFSTKPADKVSIQSIAVFARQLIAALGTQKLFGSRDGLFSSV